MGVTPLRSLPSISASFGGDACARAATPRRQDCRGSGAVALGVSGKASDAAARAVVGWALAACPFASAPAAWTAIGEPAGSAASSVVDTACGCRLAWFHEGCIRVGCLWLPATRGNDGIRSGLAEVAGCGVVAAATVSTALLCRGVEGPPGGSGGTAGLEVSGAASATAARAAVCVVVAAAAVSTALVRCGVEGAAGGSGGAAGLAVSGAASAPASRENDRIHAGRAEAACCGAATAAAMSPLSSALGCWPAPLALRCNTPRTWAPLEKAAGWGDSGLPKPAKINA
jgi:hypothetical protein